MKLVMNIPDYVKEQADVGKGEELGIPYWLVYTIANGTPLDSKTNGDVIKALFPSCKTRSENTPTNFMEFTLDGVVGYAIEKSWWNTPYKAESEEV